MNMFLKIFNYFCSYRVLRISSLIIIMIYLLQLANNLHASNFDHLKDFKFDYNRDKLILVDKTKKEKNITRVVKNRTLLKKDNFDTEVEDYFSF